MKRGDKLHGFFYTKVAFELSVFNFFYFRVFIVGMRFDAIIEILRDFPI